MPNKYNICGKQFCPVPSKSTLCSSPPGTGLESIHHGTRSTNPYKRHEKSDVNLLKAIKNPTENIAVQSWKTTAQNAIKINIIQGL